ncbi:hypothetical protein [Aquabacterium sp. OR-4]|uniref:hypothetical protein n=1 Tax=Aquabacterium sp. OR-4 TaxID=2978127 RepID=UPI0021B2C034|nr:hypothetical protein [Aquabacterium sp. OR-4]MDT7836917.1 hypothetical protein [Aquabacterium sp. OR-4]
MVAAVVRAATAAEIAANHAIRQEFAAQSGFDAAFVNSQLKWANGLSGKLDHLITPLWAHQKAKQKHLKELKKLAQSVNGKRNSVAHQGEFCNEQEAAETIDNARSFITLLLQVYEPEFALKR